MANNLVGFRSCPSRIACRSHNSILRCRGGALIMVLIVLMVIGLIANQTNQLLVAYQSSDRQSRVAEQSRELIELGMIRARQSLKLDSSYVGETFEVDVLDTLRAGTASPTILHGKVHIEIRSSDVANSLWRITATYPVGLPGESVVKWESRL